MAQAKKGDTVQVHYKGTLDDGSQFDSSEGRDPLEFTVGAGQVIPGFDNAIDGMATGESKTVKIPCADAYGEHEPERVLQVERAQLPDGLDPKVGDGLEMNNGQHSIPVVVTAVDDASITIDGNHPLAGKDLTFHLELVAIV